MIELGILALPARLVTDNPIAAYNFACLLMFVIAGTTMFALVQHWTNSWIAALAAGILFAFHPSRTGDIVHPAVIGIHWLPLVLLAFERLVAFGRARDGLLLTLSACLQVLVGSYPLLVLACFAGPFGVTRLLQNRDRLDRRRLLWLFAALSAAVFVAAVVLSVYAAGLGTWQTLRPPQSLVVADYADLLSWGTGSVGVAVIILSGGLLLPRVSKVAAPVMAVIAGTVVCLVVAAQGPMWPGGPELPSLYKLLAGYVRFLGVIRVPAAIAMGWYMGLALLAGFGLARALAHLATGPRKALASMVIVFVLLESFNPAFSESVYGHSPEMELRNIQPDEQRLQAYRSFGTRDSGQAVLDLPHKSSALGALFDMPFYTYLSAFHTRPSAACYNSHLPLSFFGVAALAKELPSDQAITELAAAGFRDFVVHHDLAPAGLAEDLVRQEGVELLYASELATALSVLRRPTTHSDTDRLIPGAVIIPRFLEPVRWGRQAVDVEIRNRSVNTWILAHPIRPHVAWVRWWEEGRAETGPWLERRLMLPLAAAPGARRGARLELAPLPPAGSYNVEIVVPELGWTLLPQEKVRVID